MSRQAGDPRRIRVLGVPIDVVSLDEARARPIRYLRSGNEEETTRGRVYHIATVNPEHVMVAQGDPRFMRLIEQCDLVVADGIGIVWAANKLGTPLPRRVPGIELAEALLEDISMTGGKVFFLGGEDGVAVRAAKRMTERFPGLNVVGTLGGYFPHGCDEDVVSEIASHAVDLLLVGLGVPKQEFWIASHKDSLKAHIVMGVGGALDVFSGNVRRAPLFWRKLHMEWMYRVMLQPSRIGRLKVLPRFVRAVYKERRLR